MKSAAGMARYVLCSLQLAFKLIMNLHLSKTVGDLGITELNELGPRLPPLTHKATLRIDHIRLVFS